MAPVVEAINRYVLTGNTLALWTPEGFYGVDFPSKELTAQLGIDDQNALRNIQRSLDQKVLVFTAP